MYNGKISHPCQYCKKDSYCSRCGHCRTAFYCKRDCQERDWAVDHKNVCKRICTLNREPIPAEHTYPTRLYEAPVFTEHVSLHIEEKETKVISTESVSSLALFPQEVYAIIMSYCSWNDVIHLARAEHLPYPKSFATYVISNSQNDEIVSEPYTKKQLCIKWKEEIQVACAHVRLAQIKYKNYTHHSRIRLVFQVADSHRPFIHLMEQMLYEFSVQPPKSKKWTRKFPMIQGQSITVDAKLDHTVNELDETDFHPWKDAQSIETTKSRIVAIHTIGLLRLHVQGSMYQALHFTDWIFLPDLNAQDFIDKTSIQKLL